MATLNWWRRPVVRRSGYAVLLIAVVAMLWTSRVGLAAIWREHLTTFIVVAGIMALGLLVQVLNFLRLIEWSRPLSIRAATHAWALATLLNYLGPFQPGLALRVAYFRSEGVPVRRTAEASLRQVHLSFWTALLAASIGFGWLGGRTYWLASGVCLASFLAWPHVLGVLRPWVLSWQRPAWLLAHQASIGIVMTPLPTRAMTYFVLQQALGTALIYYAYHAFGSTLPVGSAILITVGVYTASLVAVLPNNLGILDAFYVATAQMGGLGVDEAVALAVLLRAAHIAMCVLVAAGSWRPARAAD